MRLSLLPVSLLLLLLCLMGRAGAQCCAPGNPVGGNINPGANPSGQTLLWLGHRYGYAGRYFDGAQPIAPTFVRAGDYQHLTLSATHGLSEHLTAQAELGYVLYKRQWYVPGVRPTQLSGRGFTDLTLLVRVNVLRDEVRGWELTLGLGPKLPLGSYQQTQGGIRLPQDLQPSTGAVELVQTIFLQKTLLPRKLRFFALSHFELKGQNPEGYRFGPLLAVAAFGSYAPMPRWTFLSQLRYEWRGRDTRPLTGQGFALDNGREQVPPTGSQRLWLGPQVAFQPNPDWQISLLAEWPLFQRYHAQQLGSSFSAMVSVARWLRAGGTSGK